MDRIKIKISGMTCSGCKKTVTQALESIESIKKVTVSLENNSAIIETGNDIQINLFLNQKVLPI